MKGSSLPLSGIRITFHTHDDDKDDSTVVHVFVKNRSSNSLTPERDTDFISNMLGFQRHLEIDDGDHNPYLARGIGIGATERFSDPSSRSFDLELRSNSIGIDEVVLPVVDIHIETDGDDRWIFDYTIDFHFDDASDGSRDFSFSSNVEGIRGIVLDQDNRNYSGICVENPRGIPAVPTRPTTDAVLSRVTLEFATHNDDKDDNTRLNVHIVNRLSETSAQDIVIGLDLFPGESFPDNGTQPGLSYKVFSWSADGVGGGLASSTIRLADMVLPVTYIIIYPSGNDRWIFDYQVTFEFSDPLNHGGKHHIYSSRTDGVILDQDNNKHRGVYRGRPFPTVLPATAPQLLHQPVDHTTEPKRVSIGFLRKKLDEFVNRRNGADIDPNPPLRRIRLHNSGKYNDDALPESYADLRSITAVERPAFPGQPTVDYVSNPINLGQLKGVLGIGDLYLNDINSSALSLDIDASSTTPLTLTIDFETGGPNETVGGLGGADFLRFSIAIRLTLGLDRRMGESGIELTLVDVMSWAADLKRMSVTLVTDGVYHYVGEFLDQPVNQISGKNMRELFVEQVVKVSLVTSESYDIGGTIRQKMVDKIYDYLTTADVITGTSPRDGINSMVTSWLTGGVSDDRHNVDDNNIMINDVGIQNANPELGIAEDSIVISYQGPRNVFVPAVPTDWPAGTAASPRDFSPGNLANIEHIIVLTMENRSFDHLLGYLSLPTTKPGGMGRPDVDGLKGGESNVHKGVTFASFPLTGSVFAPDPPHGFEPVHHAINGGRMDGFVKSFAEAHGSQDAGKIMGYHTGATVPVYDALARDFAVGHRWFASHPGPTFCNRFFELTGRLNLDGRGFWELDNSSPPRPVFTKTILDYLSDATDPVSGQPVTWNYFEDGYCFLRNFEKYTFDHERVIAVDDPENGFFARARTGTLPNVSFIDPHFVELPPGGNCDGPPADVRAGQELVSKVVSALVTSPAWNKSMLVIVYDEHGGFYDHVAPPAAAQVSDELALDTYGVRVPAFVVTPWVGAGAVFGHDAPFKQNGQGGFEGGAVPSAPAGADVVHDGSLHFDHTSILKTIVRRFMSDNPPYLGPRYAAAHDLSEVVGNELRQPQFLPFIRYNLKFSSTMMLAVQDGNPSRGTRLCQAAREDWAAQDFSFEDAGDGFVFIRGHVSNLYVTVREPGPAGDGDPEVFQDVKYAGPTGPRPEQQRWRLNPISPSVTQRTSFVVVSEAYPEKLLQPADSTQPASPVVVRAVDHVVGPLTGRYAWDVRSPLLDYGMTNHP
jgi:phospholipase C